MQAAHFFQNSEQPAHEQIKHLDIFP